MIPWNPACREKNILQKVTIYVKISFSSVNYMKLFGAVSPVCNFLMETELIQNVDTLPLWCKCIVPGHY